MEEDEVEKLVVVLLLLFSNSRITEVIVPAPTSTLFARFLQLQTIGWSVPLTPKVLILLGFISAGFVKTLDSKEELLFSLKS